MTTGGDPGKNWGWRLNSTNTEEWVGVPGTPSQTLANREGPTAQAQTALSQQGGTGSNPWSRPGPEGPSHICQSTPGVDSVPHVGVSKDLRVLVIFWLCGRLVALGHIHVFSPQG